MTEQNETRQNEALPSEVAEAQTAGKVFISYRRLGGFPYAMILAEKLEERGYTVFWDVESRDSGRYDEKIREEITAVEVFLLVLSHGALDRCVNAEDMVRKEILQAMEEEKEIVVFMEGNFWFPDTLPEDIAAIKYYNGVELFYSSYKAAFVELYERVAEAVERARSEKASEGLRFEPNEDGGYTVAGIGTCKDAEVVIPKKYRGKPVTGIGKKAFYECDLLTGITIPDGVTKIGPWAFSDCTSLTSITIPEGVTEIGTSVFFNCGSLTNITIPESVTEIGDDAFNYCASLTSITIPDGVTKIGDNAFYCCASLTSITIPEGVTEIRNSVFFNCGSLTNITIPESVTRIEMAAFNVCTSLTSITIPGSVTKVGLWAFSNCTSLTEFRFDGTVAAWEKMVREDEWNENTPFKVVHCTDGDVPV